MARGGRIQKVRSASSSRQVAPTQVGRPGMPSVRYSWPRWYPPLFAKQRVRTLRKVDPAVGATQPEGANLTDTPGVLTGDRGGFKGLVRLMHQMPAIPPTTGQNQRVTKAPSPTSGAGVRSPYNQKVRVGKRGNSVRVRSRGGSAPRSPGR